MGGELEVKRGGGEASQIVLTKVPAAAKVCLDASWRVLKGEAICAHFRKPKSPLRFIW